MKCSLRAIRVNKGLSQKEASKGIGISVEALANYEKGITSPNIRILKKIEKFYNVSYDEIIFLDNNYS